eukprot:3909824-Rhodomonas_salina.2
MSHRLAVVRRHARRIVLAVHPAEAAVARGASKHAASARIAHAVAAVAGAANSSVCGLEVVLRHAVHHTSLVRDARAKRLNPQPAECRMSSHTNTATAASSAGGLIAQTCR